MGSSANPRVPDPGERTGFKVLVKLLSSGRRRLGDSSGSTVHGEARLRARNSQREREVREGGRFEMDNGEGGEIRDFKRRERERRETRE